MSQSILYDVTSLSMGTYGNCEHYFGILADIHHQIFTYNKVYNEYKDDFIEYIGLSLVDKFNMELVEIGCLLNKINLKLSLHSLIFLIFKIQMAQQQLRLMEYRMMKINEIVIPNNSIDFGKSFVLKMNEIKCSAIILQLQEKANEFDSKMK